MASLVKMAEKELPSVSSPFKPFSPQLSNYAW